MRCKITELFFLSAVMNRRLCWKQVLAMEFVISAPLLKPYGVIPSLLLAYGFIINSRYVYGDADFQISNPILAGSFSLVCKNITCRSTIEASLQCERATECRGFYFHTEKAFCSIYKCDGNSTQHSFSPDGQVHLLAVKAFIPGDLIGFYSKYVYIYRERARAGERKKEMFRQRPALSTDEKFTLFLFCISPPLSMYVYIYIDIYIYIYMYMFTCKSIYIYIRIHLHSCLYIREYIHHQIHS